MSRSMWWLWTACAPAPVEPVAVEAEPPEPVVHVRGGVVRASGQGRRLADGRVLVDGAAPDAPQVASCVPLFSADLGDASATVARGGESPDADVAFSPDGAWVAVGTALGEVAVFDAWTGAERARRRFDEAVVKRVRWSADGALLFAAEQSPDAMLRALVPEDLSERAALRLADDVESSAPPPGDLYGVYTLPAGQVLEDVGGDLLVSAVHGWDTERGRRNRSRLLRLRVDGDQFVRVAEWPAAGAADAVFGGVAVDGDRVAVAIRRSAAGPAPSDLPIDGVQVLDERLKPLRSARIPALMPYFSDVFIWDALALDGQTVFAGLGDGRVIADRPGHRHVEPVGAPVLAGDVPIAASVGHLAADAGVVVAITSRTNIPFGAASPELRPPQAHPAENALHAWRVEGTSLVPAYTWRGAHDLQGLTLGARELVVGAGPRQTDARTDLFGALVFDRVDGRLTAVCETAAPVFFRHALAADGRVAVVEVPYRAGDSVAGAYRLTVLR